VAQGGFPLVWIGQVKEQQVVPVAWWGPAADYLKNIKVEIQGKFSTGPTGTCIREDHPVTNNDFAINPATSPWRKIARPFGFRSSIAFPLHCQGKVIGALTLYSPDPNSFDTEQVDLIEALAADVSYALDAISKEQLQKQAEQSLSESEERYRLLYENSMDGIFITRPDGTILAANPTACRIFGRTEAEICSLGRSGMVDMTDPRVAAAVKERDRTGSFRTEMTLIRNDGTRFEGEVSSTLFKDRDGDIKTSMIFRDVTESKLAEEALRQSEQKFSILFEKAAFAIALSRFSDGAIIDVNEAFERTFGFAKQEVVGKTSLELGINPDPVGRAHILAVLKEHGSVEDVEATFQMKSGESRIMIVNMAIVDIGDQKYILNVTHDITERKQAEKNLRVNQEKYQRLVENINDLLCEVDQNGCFTYVNPHYQTILGYSPQELLGTRVADIGFREQHEIAQQKLQELINDRQPSLETWRFRHKNGKWLWMECSGMVYEKAPGEISVVVISRDITQRRQAEEEIRRLNSELEQRVLERTADLANTNSLLQEEMAEVVKTHKSLQDLYTRFRIVAEYTGDWEYWVDKENNFVFTSPSCKEITGYEQEDFIRDPNLRWQIIHPDDLPIWEKHHAEELLEKPGRQIEFRIKRADGSICWIGHVCQPVYDNQGIYIGTRGSSRDITQRKQAEYDTLNHMARAEALVRTSSRLNAQLDLHTLLEVVCQEAAAALQAPAGWINLYDPKQDAFHFSGDFGISSEFKERYHPPSRALYEEDADRMGPIIAIPDVQLLPDNPNHELYVSFNIHSIIYASMLRDDQLIGSLCVISYGEIRLFSEHELSLLQGLANQAAQAIVNARLFEQVSAGRQHMRALSQALIEIEETERRNLALELHDELGQLLSAVKMSLDLIPNLPKPAADQRIQRAQTILGDLIGQVRRMALNLRPGMLDDNGLLPAVLWLFKNYQSQCGEAVSFEHAGLGKRLPPDVEIAAYRIIQEGLTNVMRHAGDKRVYVNIRSDEEFLNMQISDFGVGFNPDAAPSKTVSSGLSGMRERARLLDGELTIKSAPGKGTSLVVRLPLVRLQGNPLNHQDGQLLG
jgi:PAS domain S-box-containing protein